ncbi:MAG: helix-turn-helix domain-containing protein [Polyangiaceae bacterium]
MQEVFTLTQAADFLQRHPKIVMQLVREAKLPVHFISSREPRFKRSELLAWLGTLPATAKESP